MKTTSHNIQDVERSVSSLKRTVVALSCALLLLVALQAYFVYEALQSERRIYNALNDIMDDTWELKHPVRG